MTHGSREDFWALYALLFGLQPELPPPAPGEPNTLTIPSAPPTDPGEGE